MSGFKDQAIRRLHRNGLTIADTMMMDNNTLLRLPFIGRKTLRWLRAFVPIE